MGRRSTSLPLVLACSLALASTLAAQSLPDRTVTIVVGGYDSGGALSSGTFGVDVELDLIESLSPMAGLPTLLTPGGLTSPDLVTTCNYYGDTPPAYYDADDLAALAAVTAAYGGGIPRYAWITARFARHVLERTGAEQVNVIAASLGAFVTRWMLENDLQGLMSAGKVARWITYEGVLAGNWAASQQPVPSFVSNLPAAAIDLIHMQYDWVEAELHAPRHELDGELFRFVQIGHELSTRDTGGGLTAALWLALGAYRPNDGVVLVEDAWFHEVTPGSRYLGRMPTRSYAPIGHSDAADHPGLWAHVVTSIQGSRRVTLTLERARFSNLGEWSLPFLTNNAEIVFESSVFSPLVDEQWGVDDALSVRDRAGATAPLWSFDAVGAWHVLEHVVYDDLVLDGEDQLVLQLNAVELDIDDQYAVLEVPDNPSGSTALGGGSFVVPIDAPGSWHIAAGSWEADLRVELTTYPVGLTLQLPEADDPRAHGVSLAGEAVPLELAAGPNQAGLTYLVLGSATGTWPGVPLPAGLLPLNWDAYTELVLASLNAPEHQAFLGVLDGMGRARASFNAAAVPLPAVAAGLTLSYAGVVFDSLGGVAVLTNPVAISVAGP